MSSSQGILRATRKSFSRRTKEHPCVGKDLLVTNAMKNKGGAFSDGREYLSDVNAIGHA